MVDVRALGALLAALLLCSCAVTSTHKPTTRSPKTMQTLKLPNGLTVTMQKDSSVPLVTLDMWVRAGGGDEKPELAGVSHFLEHMLFKGTERLAVGEYDHRIESIGGYLNAATSLDYTHYYVTFPSQHFDSVLADFADVLQNSSIDPVEVENERKVILEEISRKIDNPFGYLFDETIPALFSEGPYKHTVIGSRETVSALTRDQLAEYYHASYTPDRMFLSVVGDIDIAAAKGKIAGAFTKTGASESPRGDAPRAKFQPPADRTLPMDWNEAYFIMAFPGTASKTMKHIALCDLAETVLAGGRSSRLVNSLQEKKALVSSIGAYFPTNRHDAPLMIYGTCEPEKIPAVKEAILAEIAKLKRDGIGADEMKRAHRIARNSHLFSLETNAGRASTIGYSKVLLGNLDLLTGYEEALHSSTRGEVEKFISQYLREERASFFVTRRAAEPAAAK